MINMGELFGFSRMKNIPMDRVPLTEKEKESSMVEPGDLLFARQSLVREGAGQCAIFIEDEEQVCFESHLIRCRLNKELANPLFYYYYFSSRAGKQTIDSIIEQGAGAAGIRGSDLTKVLVPDLEKYEQDRIADIFDQIDTKIELNRQINQTLEEMAQAIFKSWFVDFDPVKTKIEAKVDGQDPERAAMCAISGKTDAELDQLPPDQFAQLRATAALFPDELIESELGLIPKGWGWNKVENVVNRLSPSKRYTKVQVSEYGAIPVLEQGASIILGYHNEEPGFIASPDKPLFIFGDHTCVCYLSCAPFDISQNVIPLSGKKYPTIWVYYAVKDKQSFQEYRRHWSEFKIKQVIIPNITLCNLFSEIVTILYQKKERAIDENNCLSQIRDTLLPKLLSGEIDLSQVA